jgi:O-Antigen ligase
MALMEGTVTPAMSVDVSNSLLLPSPTRSHPARETAEQEHQPGQERDHSIWPVIAPTVLVLALLVLATVYSGAFDVDQWGPPTLFILLLLLTLTLLGGAARLPDRWVGLALGGAWGLAAWAAVSAAWAGSPGTALEGAGREAMYAAVLTLPFVAVGGRSEAGASAENGVRALRIAGRGVVCGIALIALYTVGWMLVDGPAAFLGGRLNEPIGYRNATALLFCIAFWPLIVLAATRVRGRGLRAVALGLAVLMLGLAFLTQSRGVLVGLSCGGVVVLALGPDRVRRAWLALLSVALVAGASPWLLKPFQAFDGGHGVVHASDIAVAARALVALTAVGAIVGFLIAVFDAGLRPASPAMRRVVRPASRVGLYAVVLAVLVGGMAAVHGDPLHELRVKWREFKSLQTTTTSEVRYTSTGGQRYDLWRVALQELRANPVAGVGEGSYEFGYYRMRRTDRNLDDPHGLLFQVGAELGVVGLVLFAMIPLGLLASLRRWWSLASLQARRSACGLTVAGATFLGQSLVDWMWRIPGLTALGLLCPAVAVALLARSASAGGAAEGSVGLSSHGGNQNGRSAEAPHPEAPHPEAPHPEAPHPEAPHPEAPHRDGSSVGAGSATRRRSGLPWGRAAAGVVLLGALALVLGLYLSNVYVRRAEDEKGLSPTVQLADARTASTLDPWAVEPHYLEASALETMGRRPAARAQLEQARELEPESLVPFGLLGDFEARGGHFRAARAYYREALARDPLDTGLQQLALTGGRPSGS